jgi:hypothetical protein
MFIKTTTTIAVIGLLAIAPSVEAGSSQEQAHNPIVRYPVNAVISHPLRQLPGLPAVVYDVRKLERKMLPNRLGSAENPQADFVLQDTSPTASAATLGAGFEGLSNLDGVLPPDTVGDVGVDPATGKKYYVQMTNLSFAVFDPDTGNAIYGPVHNNTLWQALGTNNVCVQNNDGDPVVLYDQDAHRWLMSQFALPKYPRGPFYQCIAVSQTGDPTGAWNLYTYKISDTKLNDYAKFGVWSDGYYMSTNQFKCNIFSCSWQGQGVLAFERDKMLSGDPTARAVYFDLYGTDPNLGGMLPADWDGQTPPPAGSPNPFVQVDDDSWGYSPDQLQIWNFHVDWSNTANSTFSLAKKLPVASFDSNLCGYSRNCIPQPNGVKVDAISDRMMFRLQYRNFGSNQALVTNHTVDVGGDHAGIRWYELLNSGNGWDVSQQGTYAPADNDHRWMGSIAMNGAGDIALGYSVSGTNTNPSIRFTGRLNGDTLDLMTQGEGTIVAGGGSQSHSSGRWGDYSMMSVDPVDDCTFWYTQEYYAADSSYGWQTRIGSFKLHDCGTGTTDSPPSVTITNPADGATVSGAVNLTATANDDHGVSQVEFLVDDNSIGIDTNAADGWSAVWDTTTGGYPDGLHTVTAVATDSISQTGSDSNTVTVANNTGTTGPLAVHVANLDDCSAAGARGRWDACVAITVRDSDGALVNAATVSGSWSNGATGSGNCATDSNGQCQVTKKNLKSNVTSATFTVTGISASGTYDPSANTDPDGDSNGTTITVSQP